MSEVEKNEATEVNPNVLAPAQQQDPRLNAEAEVEVLRQVHVFLQEFPISGKQGGAWARMLDGIGLVANSLIAKQEDSVRAALAAKEAAAPKE